MNKMTTNLIADIGGTNIRIAQVTHDKKAYFDQIETYQCANFSSLSAVLSLYIKSKNLCDNMIHACLAIACPVDTDIISMTNLPWQFSQSELKKSLRLHSLTLINDYTAIALAIPLLTDKQKFKIGDGEAVANMPISVCGPGTGLGVANLIPLNGQWHCVSGEGGHIDFAPVGEQEIFVLGYLNKIKKRVSYEQLLSGYGLEQIYQALADKSVQIIDKTLSAQEITKRATENICLICTHTLSLFCRVLGSFSGNLALTMNSQGGVYIAGGIVPRFINFIQQSDFRQRFEAKGRLSHITQQAPTYIITEPQPGLLGAAAYLMQKSTTE